MRNLTRGMAGLTLLALCLTGPTVAAKDKDRVPGSITVNFGTGLNNAQAGNVPNHHIVPQEFKVRITRARTLDGTVVSVPATVNFAVAGFHWIWVYQRGVTLQEVVDNIPTPPTGPFVNYDVNVFAKGVFPGTPPAFADAAPFPLLSTLNRTESIAFSTPGRYLVICNVRGHLIDGMYAWVRVVGPDEDDEDAD